MDFDRRRSWKPAWGAFLPLALLVLLLNPEGRIDAAERQVELLLEARPAGSGVARPDFSAAPHAEYRKAMVSAQIAARGVAHPGVLAAMQRVPRHEFVRGVTARSAYADEPLPIGYGQTISQPFMVAYMTEALGVGATDRVLEVGTGSGYQAAILAELVRHVATVEIVGPLAASAAARLERLGYRNITVLHGDGYYGWEPDAPYDAIVVTAAASHIPPPLIAQLKPGGRMAIPVGRTAWTQNLLLVEKSPDGEITTRNLLPVAFVPLTGGH